MAVARDYLFARMESWGYSTLRGDRTFQRAVREPFGMRGKNGHCGLQLPSDGTFRAKKQKEGGEFESALHEQHAVLIGPLNIISR